MKCLAMKRRSIVRIFERPESEESAETPRTGRDYDIPRRSPEVRPRSSSPKPLVNTSSPSVRIGAQGILSVTPVNPANPRNLVKNPNATLMERTDVRLPTFNGNRIENLEQHWFLCEAVWTVRLVNNDDIQKV